MKDYPTLTYSDRKGMTWIVSYKPMESNSWAGRVACDVGYCRAYDGDTSCN
jgi:hypothetical protein